ncbi:hypothetical protein GCM10017781_19460 [Deinococcus metalli]|uniref:Uncharacterized protein n=1 Tax=Deinococcus metalli TaxID=1141878 RepID=A0ABQ3JQD0_9DEIO|nr:hypothetical protein GCM10017781_19460 [Deinococcus metalli]
MRAEAHVVRGAPGEVAFQRRDQQVGLLADQRADHVGEHGHIGAEELAGVHGQEADAAARPERFAHDQHQSRHAQGVAQADRHAGQRCRPVPDLRQEVAQSAHVDTV